MNKKSFPCWVCKGEGSRIDVVIEETGQGPIEYCGYCDGKGMIEIGGAVHRRITALALAEKIIRFVRPEKEEWEYQEILDLGNRAIDLLPPTPPTKEELLELENRK